MRSAIWTLTLLFPLWAAAEKWTLWNTLTCEQQLEEYDGLSFSRFAVYEDHIDCFDFADNVVANAVAQTKDSFCQVYTSTGCSGEEVQLSCTASNLFDPYYCCTDTPQGISMLGSVDVGSGGEHGGFGVTRGVGVLECGRSRDGGHG